jgi:hypothetical protein
MPRVVLTAENAIYQGISLRWVQVTAQQIRLHTGEILKGNPLVLSEPIPVNIQVRLTESDLNASLRNGHHPGKHSTPSLLASALSEVLQSWWQSSHQITRERLSPAIALCQASHPTPTWMQIQLQPDGLIWEMANHHTSQPAQHCILQTSLQTNASSQLQLNQPQIQIEPPSQWFSLQEYAWDLGPEVTIDTLNLETGQLSGSARLLVKP